MKKIMTAVFIIAMIMLLGGTDSSLAGAQESNTSRPRVHVIYVGAKTGDAYQKIAQRIEQKVKRVQAFYSYEMTRHGYPEQTFLIQPLPNGKLVAPIPLPTESYMNLNKHTLEQKRKDLLKQFDRDFANVRAIFLLFIDIPYDTLGYRGTSDRNPLRVGGTAYVFGDSLESRVIAHELGHAFWLEHDWRNGEYMMSYGETGNGGDAIKVDNPNSKISPGAAKWLSQHPAFNSKEVQNHSLQSINDFKVVSVQKLQNTNKHKLVCKFTRQSYPPGHEHYEDFLKSTPEYAVFLNVEVKPRTGKKDFSVIRFIDKELFGGELVNNVVEYTIEFNAELPHNAQKVQMRFLSRNRGWIWTNEDVIEGLNTTTQTSSNSTR